MLVDSHCHLNMLKLDNYPGGLDELVAKTHESGVISMLNIGVDLETAQTIIDTAQRFPNVYASVGVHPSDVKGVVPDRETLLSFMNQDKVIAIGETGLDYHYNSEHLDEMRDSFRLHIELSNELNKPLIIHTRDAREDTIAIMKEKQVKKGVMHCFTESLAMAEAALELGFYISFSGIITFKNAKELQEVVTRVPIERILIETDAPYLAPVPFRGKQNEPAYVRFVAEKVAELKGLDFDEVAKTTADNFSSLFSV